MGLFDDVDAYTDGLSNNSGKMPKGYGFNPEVCVGCEYRRTDAKGSPCGLCGCPTLENFPMDLLGMPPEDCIRLERHKE